MLKLWINTLGRAFFAQHTGMFLFVFYLVFGAVEPGQLVSYHFALLTAISSSLIGTAAFSLLFLLYLLKCLAFIRLKLALPSYHFIKESGRLHAKTQRLSWLILYLVLCSPLLTYVIMVISVGVYTNQFLNVLVLFCWCCIVLTGAVSLTFRHINYAFNTPVRLFNYNLPVVKKPFNTWRIFYLLKGQTIMLISSKVLSLFLFKAIVWMFGETDDNLKVYAIALLAAALSHSILIATVWRFERTQLSFINSLPIAHWRRLVGLFAFFTLLFIPELLIYTKLAAFSPSAALTGILFCIGSLSIFYCSLYFFGDDMDRYLKFTFGFFAFAMLMILYNQVLIFGIVLIVISAGYHRVLFNTSKL